jgi:hypothetical protein
LQVLEVALQGMNHPSMIVQLVARILKRDDVRVHLALQLLLIGLDRLDVITHTVHEILEELAVVL